MQPLFFRRNFERRADVFPASLSSASIAQEAFKLQELTLILSHYLPVILGGVLLLLVVLTAVVIYLSIRTSDMKRDLEVNAETAKALAAQAAGTTLERIEALSRRLGPQKFPEQSLCEFSRVDQFRKSGSRAASRTNE